MGVTPIEEMRLSPLPVPGVELRREGLGPCGREAVPVTWGPTAEPIPPHRARWSRGPNVVPAVTETPWRVDYSPGQGAPVSPTEEVLAEARAGRMFILVDDEDRENEGDLVIPAQFATPEVINFMAKHARGLICLAMTEHRVAQLGLPPMVQTNGTRHQTAFTVSVEAREGVTTGISAYDRARTIAVAIDPKLGREDIVTPGHVFPLVARDGGVLVRAGHTEAAVDVVRLAGLNPAGVICEIMNDDGTMARMPDLAAFARRHGLKLGTIADLIAYRRRTERAVRQARQGLESAS
jgi:3,4-dihydroxy 2-butanone 4-phosphate synthase / GTP cyclohydrolase II